MQWKQILAAILTKKAKGYNIKEKTEEYVVTDGALTLTKRKIVTKHIPSDINAAKAMLELSALESEEVTNMSDQQLEAEKLRLLNMLAVCNKYKIENITEQPKTEEQNKSD